MSGTQEWYVQEYVEEYLLIESVVPAKRASLLDVDCGDSNWERKVVSDVHCGDSTKTMILLAMYTARTGLSETEANRCHDIDWSRQCTSVTGYYNYRSACSSERSGLQAYYIHYNGNVQCHYHDTKSQFFGYAYSSLLSTNALR